MFRRIAKIFLIFWLIWFPIQGVQAVAMPFCQHDQPTSHAPAASHAPHCAMHADLKHADLKKPVGNHVSCDHCTTCKLCCLPAIPSLGSALTAFPDVHLAYLMEKQEFASFIPELPQRPPLA